MLAKYEKMLVAASIFLYKPQVNGAIAPKIATKDEVIRGGPI